MAKKRTTARIKPALLIWARRTSRYTPEDAAAKAGVALAKLQAWEAGKDRPSIPQLRKLAEVYKRPLAVFYLSQPPTDFDAMRDFRRLPAGAIEESPRLAAEIRWAHEMRAVALEAFATEIDVATLSLQAEVNEDPGAVAARVRNALGISLAAQQRWHTAYDALNGWRTAVENQGVLCFQFTGVDVSEARGFSISESALPVVAVNAKDAPTARVFTILHELTHLMLGAAGMCDLHEASRSKNATDKTEIFCNAVAGETLVPSAALLADAIVRAHRRGADWTDTELKKLGARFHVSAEVVVRRLVAHRLATQVFYQQKRDEYLRLRKDARDSSGGDYYRNLKTKLGVPLIRGVMSAYQGGRITANEASAYLRVKVDHLTRLLEVAT